MAMKKFFLWFIIGSFALGAINPSKAQAMDGKIKALGMIALYGTIGGALLGTASLAFGSRPRAILQGASLGLYAGLIFGSYIVISHSFRDKVPTGDDEAPAPEEEASIYLPQINEKKMLLDISTSVAKRDFGINQSQDAKRFLNLYIPVLQISF